MYQPTELDAFPASVARGPQLSPELSGLMHPVLSVNRLHTLFILQKFVEMSCLLMVLFIVVELSLCILLVSRNGVKINTLLILPS